MMLIALVLAALLGGAGGLLWHWLAGDELPVAEDAASVATGEEAEPVETPSPTPTIAPPAPSPNAG